ncbi:TetR/AcrR family transcriptional regulator [Bailinhaonella thermotolerans]|uniref:TetR/AcrR family transcriptional regulator n=1 Tax=Bailinhaonella thermotolerans TaxID=1070861 RepID=A0A3A4AZD8_9ACTN|nr:TetR/AcrR family transcriptional regulator [Bailinhaonella thermotolerans]
MWDLIEPAAARRLLAGAVALFAERGYGGASTRDIAERAGMSPAAMYVHYATKAELLFTIVRAVHEAAHAAVVTARDAAPGHAARVRAATYALARFHARHQQAARVTQIELAGLDADRRAFIQELRDGTDAVFHEEVRAGAEAGVFDVADPPGTARAVVSLCVDVARWYRPGGPRTPEEVGSLYAHLAARMLAVQ